jgi:type I restriction enzyme S subunit
VSLPAYPAYRDSGLPWLGQVPAHWTTVRVKDCFRIVNGATPRSDVPEYWDGDVVWVTPADLSGADGWHIATSQRSLSTAGLEACAATIVPPGSIIVSTRAPIGSIGIAAVPLCTNQGCRALVPHPGSETRFHAYALTAFTPQLNLHGRGTTFLELSGDALGAFPVCAPPPAEQRAIAAFLDRECGKMDALVAEQERLIALLKEKRQAVISHAVTKGLDPTAPMKDSGVAWLGQVPAHWEVVRGRRIFVERDERSEDGDETLLTVSHLTGVTPRAEKTVYMFEAETTEGYKLCHRGDLVINTLWAWMGAMGVASEPGIVSPAYHVYTPTAEVEPGYVNVLVRMGVFAREAERWSKGVWSSRLRLYPEEFLKIEFPLPPLAEQQAITAFLDRECSKLDTLTTEAERAIALLKERRAALISAAVTGKIDVRGLAAPTEAKAA